MELNQEVVVEITDVAFGGSGVGRLPEGGVVFVPYAALGDRLRVRLTSVRSSFAFGEILEIVEPGEGRCEPRCPHYGVCGGCQYQHIAYPQELAAKRKQLGDLLHRIGGLAEIPAVEPCLGAPEQYGYRNKFRLEPFQRPRTPEDGEGVRKVVEYGYYRLDNRTILPIHRCALVCDSLNALLKSALKSDWARQNARRAAKETPDGGASAGGEAESAGPRRGRPARVQETPGALTLRQAADGRGVFFFGRAPRNLSWLHEELGGIEYAVPCGSFWQVNPAVASQLVATAGQWLAEVPWLATFVDAYSGVGTFSAAIKYPFVERLLIESDRDAAEAAKLNLAKSGYAHQVIADTTEHALPKLLPKCQPESTAVLLDPPRSGCQPRVLEILAQCHPRAILYVSCNPSTLARDLKPLVAAGYALQRLGLFDMFPRTAHFESAALLLWPREASPATAEK